MKRRKGEHIMYEFIGQPLVDVGIAALTALAGRSTPNALIPADLERVAGRLAAWYTEPGSIRNFAKGSVFHNAGYGFDNPVLQREHIAHTLDAWRTVGSLGEPCAFCGQPAAYRASRREIPMLSGQALVNFGGRGIAGVPVCGRCSLALQALPFGCMRSGGHLIACHSDDPTLTLALARTAVQRAERAITLDGVLPVFSAERTRFVELLVDWLAAVERRSARLLATNHAPTLTGYIFTNAGASAAIQIYTLDSAVVGFVESALHNADGSLTDAWRRAIARAWGHGKAKKGEAAIDVTDMMQRPNRLYEALLKLPTGARAFLRMYVLPTNHWGLTALYLRKVMGMEQNQIDLLKTLGVRFAAYTQTRKRFFYPFAREQQYAKWRRHVLNGRDDYQRASGLALITFEEFVAAFTAAPGEINDWKLARDLVVLAMLDAGIQPDTPMFENDDSTTESEDDLTETPDLATEAADE